MLKDLDQIDETDLQDLIDDEISEGKRVEYKEILPGNSDYEKKEFLADVSSFSNALGGFLIYGISEDSYKGIPKELIGLNITNPDEEINRLENIIKHGFEPRIPTINIKAVKLINSTYGYALVFKIGKSWISPHRVVFKGHDKFYSRTSSGKFPMDVSELRTAFTLSETLNDRIKNFRRNRIAEISSGNSPAFLKDGAKLLINLIPINAFSSEMNYDLPNIGWDIQKNLAPMHCNGWNHHHNFDGFITYCGPKKDESNSYVQIFRNGILEVAIGAHDTESNNLYEVYGESSIIQYIYQYFKAMENLGVDMPISIFITLIDVKGYTLPSHSIRSSLSNDIIIDRDVLELQGILIDEFEDKIEDLLKPVFDTVWNACGIEKSPNYNDNGEWEPQS
ncbi:MAG: ATP-binding protein [Methanobacterium sp.]|nr:ATP-binding protein [Methanobacterium sp.]